MINNVVLVGRLTRDVDLRYTQSGSAVANFTVAVERNYRDQQGERQTDFISCVMWTKAAENFAKFTRKGSLVGIEGSIQTRNYENQQGQRVYVTEVRANNFSLLEPKSVTDSRPRSNDGGYAQAGAFAGYDQAGQVPYGASNDTRQTPSSSSFGAGGNTQADPFAGASLNNANPFPASDNQAGNMGANAGNPLDISDDDLPF